MKKNLELDLELSSLFNDCSMGLSFFLHNIRNSRTIELIERGLELLEALKQGRDYVEGKKRIEISQIPVCEGYNRVKECLKEENFDDFVNEIETLLNHAKDFLKGKRSDEPDKEEIEKVQTLTFKISDPCLIRVSRAVSPFVRGSF